MSEARGRTETSLNAARRFAVALSLAAAGWVALALGPALDTATADTNLCPDLYACTWGQSDFTGQRDIIDGGVYGGTGWWHWTDYNRNSAKNRYNSRTIKIGRKVGPGDFDQISCLGPGDNRPDPGWFDAYKVSSVGDGCG
jgi:hypothetical protein